MPITSNKWNVENLAMNSQVKKNGYNCKECQKLTKSKVNKRGKKIIGKINK
jgi:hypothetical protein